MVVTGWRVAERDGGWTVGFTARTATEAHEVFFDVELPESLRSLSVDLDAIPRAELTMAATLIPAMRAALDVRLPGPPSPGTPGRVESLQDLVDGWWEALGKVGVEFDEEETKSSRAEPPLDGMAFFSAGVDSWYTALRGGDHIDALIAIHGFDVLLDRGELWTQVRASLEDAAVRIGKPLVVVRTNVREFQERYVHWKHSFGGALAAVGLALAPLGRTIYISSSQPRSQARPDGSHPDLDPLWRGGTQRIVHFGGEASRVDKTVYIAEHPVARETLRVCWSLDEDVYNCSRCSKCLRTMAVLELVGRLDDTPTFRSVGVRRAIRWCSLPASDARKLVFHDQILDHFRELAPDAPVLRDLRFAIRILPVRVLWKRLRDGFNRARWTLADRIRRPFHS